MEELPSNGAGRLTEMQMMDTFGRDNSEKPKTNNDNAKKTVVASNPEQRNKQLLFSPRNSRPSGDVLEIVSYWGDTVLDVELFHKSYKGFDQCRIGVPPHAHMVAGGKSEIKSFPFVKLTSSGFKIKMLQDMKARIRKGGKVSEKSGSGSISLDMNDIAHVVHGPVKYFLMYIKPPPLRLRGAKIEIRYFQLLLCLQLYFI